MNSNLFKRKEHVNVYSILVYQCEKALEAAGLLLKLMSDKDVELADQIEKIETEADEKRSDLISYVENTYITDLDRRDLYALSRTLDDITDAITELKDFLVFFKYLPGENAIESLKLAIDSISNITEAMTKWTTEETPAFLAQLKVAEQNETAAKRLFWKTLYEISHDGSVKQILIEKEFCRGLNNLSAIISKASDRMSDLKIKSIK